MEDLVYAELRKMSVPQLKKVLRYAEDLMAQRNQPSLDPERDFWAGIKAIMDALGGINPIGKRRVAPLPTARYILAAWMVSRGHRMGVVAGYLGVDRTTLVHGVGNLPYIYDDKVKEIKEKFKKNIEEYENESGNAL